MTRMRPQDTVVRSRSDLYELWRSLMGEGGFGRRSLWLLFFTEDGRPEPVIVPIDDIPRRPDRRFVEALGSIVTELARNGEVASAAVLLSRPGTPSMTEEDRCWARALAPLTPWWPVHLATADRMQVFAPDDLVTPQDAA